MAFYKIRWKKSARKELKSIQPNYIPTILAVIEKLAQNPFPPQCKKVDRF